MNNWFLAFFENGRLLLEKFKPHLLASVHSISLGQPSVMISIPMFISSPIHDSVGIVVGERVEGFDVGKIDGYGVGALDG